MTNDVLYINGKAVPEEPAGEFADEEGGQTLMEPMFKETLPGGATHFILDLTERGPSTTRPSSRCRPATSSAWATIATTRSDSRTTQVGYVPVENLIGRAEILFFSVDDTVRFFEPWTWPTAIRWGRILNLIR